MRRILFAIAGRTGAQRSTAQVSGVKIPGPTLAGLFLAAGLIDRVVAYIAPVLIGGGGRPALAGPGALNIADARRFQLEDVARIGPDVRLTATPLSSRPRSLRRSNGVRSRR